MSRATELLCPDRCEGFEAPHTHRIDDYEAAVEALERLVGWWDAEYRARPEWAKSIDLRNEASAALARLRDTVPA